MGKPALDKFDKLCYFHTIDKKIEVLCIISNRRNRVCGRSGRADGERGGGRDARGPVRASVFGENTPHTVTDVERYRVSL